MSHKIGLTLTQYINLFPIATASIQSALKPQLGADQHQQEQSAQESLEPVVVQCNPGQQSLLPASANHPPSQPSATDPDRPSPFKVPDSDKFRISVGRISDCPHRMGNWAVACNRASSSSTPLLPKSHQLSSAATSGAPSRAIYSTHSPEHPTAPLDRRRDFQQRIEAINLMVALCDKRETVKRVRIQHRAKACLPINTEEWVSFTELFGWVNKEKVEQSRQNVRGLGQEVDLGKKWTEGKKRLTSTNQLSALIVRPTSRANPPASLHKVTTSSKRAWPSRYFPPPTI
ncbi:hypothetical protein AUP68_00647 [Ilyonectria robusta]